MGTAIRALSRSGNRWFDDRLMRSLLDGRHGLVANKVERLLETLEGLGVDLKPAVKRWRSTAGKEARSAFDELRVALWLHRSGFADSIISVGRMDRPDVVFSRDGEKRHAEVKSLQPTHPFFDTLVDRIDQEEYLDRRFLARIQVDRREGSGSVRSTGDALRVAESEVAGVLEVLRAELRYGKSFSAKGSPDARFVERIRVLYPKQPLAAPSLVYQPAGPTTLSLSRRSERLVAETSLLDRARDQTARGIDELASARGHESLDDLLAITVTGLGVVDAAVGDAILDGLRRDNLLGRVSIVILDEFGRRIAGVGRFGEGAERDSAAHE